MSKRTPDPGGICFRNGDVQEINRRVLSLIRNTECGAQVAQSLQVSRDVYRIIHLASSYGLQTAIHCRIPLVTFSREFTEALADPAEILSPSSSQVQQVPSLLLELSAFVLIFARELEREYAQTFFGLTPRLVESLAGVALGRLERICRAVRVVLRLRDGDQPQLWDEFLIGTKATGSHAYQIAAESAGLGLLRVRSET